MPATVNALDIAVSDLTAAIEFYRRLGLEFVRDEHWPDEGAGCDLPNGMHLMLGSDELRGKLAAAGNPRPLSTARPCRTA
ncbi:VOC family protein [Kribbella sp. NPDC050820]|uniref:VOC family protein n=1 Tax=Kribbella sp. NPDC050820 TaxID=3155408 RepID=UPI0033C7CF12